MQIKVMQKNGPLCGIPALVITSQKLYFQSGRAKGNVACIFYFNPFWFSNHVTFVPSNMLRIRILLKGNIKILTLIELCDADRAVTYLVGTRSNVKAWLVAYSHGGHFLKTHG